MDVKQYLVSLVEKYKTNPESTQFKTLNAIFERLNKIEKWEDKFTLDDILAILKILKNDELLNRYCAEQNEVNERTSMYEGITIDGYTDFGTDIQKMFPQYNDAALESIQGLIQHFGAQMIDPIAGSIYQEDGRFVGWDIQHASIKRLEEVGFGVAISFSKLATDISSEINQSLNGEEYFITLTFTLPHFDVQF